MSLPPQLIRVKRKRVEEAPVTFLQFDQGSKRHRSGSNWAYQRRESTTQRPQDFNTKTTEPVIHVSKPGEASPPTKKRQQEQISPKPEKKDQNASINLEPRRFRVSKAMLARAAGASRGATGITKKGKHGPTVFVEATRKLRIPKTRRSLAASQALLLPEADVPPTSASTQPPDEERQLKKPGVANRARAGQQEQQAPPVRAPLPASLVNRHTEDMDKIATDMNQWVLNEIGANLHSMEQEKQAHAAKFKPKVPVKRYQERHPDLAPPPVLEPHDKTSEAQADTAMGDASDEEDDDDEWIIEEYIRIPAKSVALDVSPGDVGILVLDEEEENMLFFGSAADDDDDMAEDEEDENAENHYTADYPEDEVESDDEYGRQAYGYRYGNNSDDEEFDNEFYEEQDEMVLEGDADEDDDARMTRIRDFMRRNQAFG